MGSFVLMFQINIAVIVSKYYILMDTENHCYEDVIEDLIKVSVVMIRLAEKLHK